MVRFQPKLLLLKTMSESLTMQQQGSVLMSVAHITTRKHGDILGCRGPHVCSGAVQNCPCPSLAVALWRAGHISHHQQHQRVSPAPYLDRTAELNLVVGALVGQTQGRGHSDLPSPLI